MKRLLAVLLGFLPIPIGMLFQQMIFSIQLPLYNILLSLGFLLFWMLLSRLLRKWLSSTRQTILLLNRRGYHTAAVCRECGEAVRCSLCSVPMVYHKQENRL